MAVIRFILVVFLLVLIPFKALFAQTEYAGYLLNHPGVKLESAEAVDALYNFKYDKAEQGFRWLKFKFPKHPLPFFLLGLNEWWKIMPEDEVTKYDDKFQAYMDTAIIYAEAIYKKDKENQEAIFFLAASHGFKGRLHADRKNWTRAAMHGKEAMNYMELSKRNADFGIEFAFGHGLYDYYREWIPENYKMLRPVMVMFPKGNRQRGIDALEEVTTNAFFTRIEAMYYLSRIYGNEEKKPDKALPRFKYLYETYPDNAYFHRSYTRMAYYMGDYVTAEKLAQDMIKKLAVKQIGYGPTAGRYATFVLGDIYYRYKGNLDLAKIYLAECRNWTKENNATQQGYYLYSTAYLARIAVKESRVNDARELYKDLEDNADKKSDLYKEAKKWLKANPEKRKKFLGIF